MESNNLNESFRKVTDGILELAELTKAGIAKLDQIDRDMRGGDDGEE